MVCQGCKHSWKTRSCIKSPLYTNFLMENWRQGWIRSAVRYLSYQEENVSVLEEPTVPSPLSTICHMDKSEGRRSRLPSSQASSRITDIPFSAAYGLFLFPLQFFSGGKPGHAAGGSTGGDAHVAGGASAGGHLPVLLLPAPVKGLSPASKACPETLWNRRLIFHAEQNENPTVTSFTSQCW